MVGRKFHLACFSARVAAQPVNDAASGNGNEPWTEWAHRIVGVTHHMDAVSSISCTASSTSVGCLKQRPASAIGYYGVMPSSNRR